MTSARQKLLALSNKNTRNVIFDRKSKTHMIAFPKFWLQKWGKCRKVFIKFRGDSLFVYQSNSKESNSSIVKFGDAIYIKIDEEYIEKMNYPESLQLVYCDDGTRKYLEILIPTEEKERIKREESKIKKKKMNEKMIQTYSQVI